ncbi:MAG: hypothetical protein WCA07_08135 [Gloeobacterales cyanobacterium]
MNRSQIKSLTFYGGTIAFVIGLFSLVTSYGEANLKTAQSISGDYLLTLPSSSNCKIQEPIALSIQQSGVYVAASMTKQTSKSQATFKPMTLSGQWQNQRLSLAGNVSTKMLCANSKDQTSIAVIIEGAIAPHQESAPKQTPAQSATLVGTLSLNQTTAPLTAKRQTVSKDEEK